MSEKEKKVFWAGLVTESHLLFRWGHSFGLMESISYNLCPLFLNRQSTLMFCTFQSVPLPGRVRLRKSFNKTWMSNNQSTLLILLVLEFFPLCTRSDEWRINYIKIRKNAVLTNKLPNVIIIVVILRDFFYGRTTSGSESGRIHRWRNSTH